MSGKRLHRWNAAGGKLLGFTLIELLVAMVIVAILAAIALPAYTDIVKRGHRANARSQLQLAANYLQRFYASNDSFLVDRSGNSAASIIAATGYLQSPSDGDAVYRIAFDISDSAYKSTLLANSFELRIYPVGDGPMAGDKCGAFILDSTGRRSLTGSGTLQECWK